MNGPEHWDTIYRTKDEREVSWFEQVPAHDAGGTMQSFQYSRFQRVN